MRGTGDCEDVAILLCSMARAIGISEKNIFVAVGSVPGSKESHAYLFEHCTSGMWKIIEPQIDSVTSALTLKLVDTISTYDYSEGILCFNDCYYFNGPPELPQGMFEVELPNSFWPFVAGTPIQFTREMESGQALNGVVEWHGEDKFMFKWYVNIYGPAGDMVLSWEGKDLAHDFTFVTSKPGMYTVEILKWDFAPRCLRLTLDPPEWEQLVKK
jgi:hypothetical protein